MLLLAGCGSNGGGSSSSTNSPPSSQQPPPSGGVLNSPNVVSVGGGGTVSGVDIAVVSPSGTAPNAQVLGVAVQNSGGGSAANTGDQMHRGSTVQVLLFGAGLNGSMQVQLSGPQDYTIASKTSIVSTDNTPGIEFTLTLNADAALGDRTVILIDGQNNVTTFTGGLEVLP
jgi:hypothetical protein